ncbi:piggyBac transposable element-derived protein 3-like [Rhipicephalus sanguineus]|uniref:piggyBac transposable element-derived protein 3-like n=1 Tax=Rhipicephalus sanguineus TaxID=34632 RepID=UPI0020C5A75E|nr:piggyBac transposable element-derived protein 3-like [Rhipicephalus sanguineus]
MTNSKMSAFQPVVDKHHRKSWFHLDYFKQYIPDELFDAMAMSMNTGHVLETGKSLNTTADELKTFFGMSITMSCLGYPQMRRYWSTKTRVPVVADKMPRDRYFKLRSRLKVVNELDVAAEEKEKDKLWRIRPFVKAILNGCLQLPREECLSIDEQMIPFTGRTHLKQFVPRKPNPEGLKNFVLTTPSGLILDFEIYQGKKSTLFQASSGIGESAVLRLSNNLAPGTQLFFNRYFISGPLLDKLAKKDISGTGPVMNNRIPKGVNLSSESELKLKGRGTSEMVERDDEQQVVVRWYDNKAITLMSSLHGKQPEDTCRRWSNKDKKHVNIARPNIVCLYNKNMGGVDMADRMISYYRMKARVSKWTIRCFFHLMDMALSNSWLQYTRDMRDQQKRPREVLEFLDFRVSVAAALVNEAFRIASDSDSGSGSQLPTKRAPLPPLPVRKTFGHFPRLADIPNAARCRMEGCIMKTVFLRKVPTVLLHHEGTAML